MWARVGWFQCDRTLQCGRRGFDVPSQKQSLAQVIRRVSVGGSLTWVAVKAFADAARAIRDSGDFSGLATMLPLDEWLAG